MADTKPTIKFEYLKSASFRVVHSDGVFGGTTPQGDIFVSFYNERFPLPKSLVNEVEPDGTLGPEVRSDRVEEGRNVIRELEVGVHLSVPMAKIVAEWLLKKVAHAEKRKASRLQKAEQLQ